MRWTLIAAAAAIAATLGVAGQAAPPTTATPASAEAITFEQYRDWRLDQIARRRDQLAAQLAAADLSAEHKARLERIKAYYDWLAGLPEADRDRRFRDRFDRIDANHDGTIDPAERAQWRDKQRAFYGRGRASAQPAATAAQTARQ